MIREFHPDDLPTCADLLIEAYNHEPWNYHWTRETATRYLNEFVTSENFIGFVLCEDTIIVGAMFAHRKTWWTKDELFVDEVYIAPQCQRQGYGAKLLYHAEGFAKVEGLAGLTLLTDRNMPAVAFYAKHGYLQAEHVVFMYKVG